MSSGRGSRSYKKKPILSKMEVSCNHSKEGFVNPFVQPLCKEISAPTTPIMPLSPLIGMDIVKQDLFVIADT